MKVKCKFCGKVFYPPKIYWDDFNNKKCPVRCTECGKYGVVIVGKKEGK